MTTRFRRKDDLRLTELEGEGVVLDMGSRDYFTVSETGLTILEALQRDRTVDELVDELVGQYEVSPEEARASVVGFLDQCREHGLLVPPDAG